MYRNIFLILVIIYQILGSVALFGDSIFYSPSDDRAFSGLILILGPIMYGLFSLPTLLLSLHNEYRFLRKPFFAISFFAAVIIIIATFNPIYLSWSSRIIVQHTTNAILLSLIPFWIALLVYSIYLSFRKAKPVTNIDS